MRKALVFIKQNKLLSKEYRELCYSYAEKNKFSITTISEETSADILISESQGKKYLREDAELFPLLMKIIDIESIIQRERYFRSCASREDALESILNIAASIYINIAHGAFESLITPPVDNFILDILATICENRNIEVIGIQRFYVPGMARKTFRGEYNFVRRISAQEVLDYYNSYLLGYKNSFAPNKKRVYNQVIKYYIIYKFKVLFHYLLLYKILNIKKYKYYSTKCQVYPRAPLKSYFFYKKYCKSLKEIDVGKPIVYIPLHYYPEATVEYWMDLKYADYYTYLKHVAFSLECAGYTVILKEHPAIYMKRNTDYLHELICTGDINLLSPFVSTKDVLGKSDAVIIWTGTTGVESIMSDVPTYFVSSNFYNKDNNRNWKQLLSNEPSNHGQNKDLAIKTLLETTFYVD